MEPPASSVLMVGYVQPMKTDVNLVCGLLSDLDGIKGFSILTILTRIIYYITRKYCSYVLVASTIRCLRKVLLQSLILMMSVGSYSAQQPPPSKKICHWPGYYFPESVRPLTTRARTHVHTHTQLFAHVYKTPDP